MAIEWTEERIAALDALIQEGLSASKIAARWGVTRNVIISAWTRYQLRTDGPDRGKHLRGHGARNRRRSTYEVESWDAKLFEPWEVRKARRAREKEEARV